ncbi:uncharacterized protein EKO05_0004646 [Ascochyta rabiei]|uniref:uncharacterized protein n=1 Tax=Didymella rabiei TaxID=5454 RepID=UPI0022081F7D|nr:uncharacterized protein EKO05_0004646 [Ascochyta rabiei]UPX14156.1 hypothetical protein EKO05_0004646 [Ascochyta rabiei]
MDSSAPADDVAAPANTAAALAAAPALPPLPPAPGPPTAAALLAMPPASRACTRLASRPVQRQLEFRAGYEPSKFNLAGK